MLRMAKAQSAPVVQGQSSSIPLDAAIKVTINVTGVKDVMIDCAPGDLEKYWMRPDPATFFCETGKTYVFSVPDVVGYSPFKHWWNPKTETVVSTKPRLELPVGKKNERYVAIYDEVLPVDVVFKGSDSRDSFTVYASKPDINGRTEVVAPGRLTYLSGTKVGFRVERERAVGKDDVLYGKVFETHTFQYWEEGVNVYGRDLQIHVVVDRPLKFTAVFVKTPAPVTPTERQVYVLEQQLTRVIRNNEPSSFVVLLNGKITPLFGHFTFVSEKAARTSIRAAVDQFTQDFLTQASEEWRDWLKVEPQREKLIEHWLKTNVQVVRLDRLVVQQMEPENNVNTQTNEAGANVAQLPTGRSGGATNLKSAR